MKTVMQLYTGLYVCFTLMSVLMFVITTAAGPYLPSNPFTSYGFAATWLLTTIFYSLTIQNINIAVRIILTILTVIVMVALLRIYTESRELNNFFAMISEGCYKLLYHQ